MDTLTYGLKVPRTPDTGATFFPALEANIEQLDAHTHDGDTSAPIVKTQSVSASGWSETPAGSGTYRKLVTMTGSLTYDTVAIQVRETSSGDLIYPTIEKVSSTTFYIYMNRNDTALTVVYT